MYSSGQGPQIDLFLKSSDGSKKEELLFGNSARKWVDDWSSDGRYIIYYQADPTNGNYDLWILPMIGDRKPRPYLQTTFGENHGAISPDGRWLAYTSNETGRPEVYVRTFPDPNQGKWQVSTSGGDQARWRRDGKELFFMASDKNSQLFRLSLVKTSCLAHKPFFFARLLDTTIKAATAINMHLQPMVSVF